MSEIDRCLGLVLGRRLDLAAGKGPSRWTDGTGY